MTNCWKLYQVSSQIKADVKGNLPSELSFEVKYISCSNREISHIAVVDTVFTPMGCRVFMAGYIQVLIKRENKNCVF